MRFRSDAKVRLLFGDQSSEAVALRGREEGTGDGMAARVRLALSLLRGVADVSGMQIRLHDATLYNLIYRFDDELLVNTHVYGAMAARSPVLRLRWIMGGRLFDHYMASSSGCGTARYQWPRVEHGER